MKLKKNQLMMAGMFVASFAIINAGMHFFLRATQPKTASRRTEVVAKVKAVDSTATLAARKDSLVKIAPDTAMVPMLPVNLAAVVDTTPPPIAQTTASDTTAPALAAIEPTDVREAGSTADTTLEAADNADELQPIVEQPEDTRELGKLAKLLESMKPADAASIAARLDEDQIIALVMRMKDRTGGKMLAALPVEQAARVATRMSQMVMRTRAGS